MDATMARNPNSALTGRQAIGEKAYPLMMAQVGERVRIVAMKGGAAIDKRLTEMGLNLGAELALCLREESGVVVMRGNSRLALGAALAHRLWVTPANHEDMERCK